MTQERATHVAVIELRDGLSEAVFAKRLARAADGGAPYVVADLAAVELPGWRALAALRAVGARLRARHGDLGVVAGDRLARLLRLTLLNRGFTVFHARSDAVAADPSSSTVVLDVPAGGSFESVRHLVTAGVGSRAALPIDRIDALQLDLDRLLESARGRRTIALTPEPDGLRVEVGPLAPADASPRLDCVLSSLVSEAETGRCGDEVWITLRVPRTPAVAESR